MTETWKAVVGYEGIYEVSDFGRVRRIARGCHTRPGRIVKATPHSKEKKYLRVSLSANNIRKSFRVHKLVARAFIGECPEGFTVNHEDLKNINNRSRNLEYVTGLANYWHARKKDKKRMGVTISDEAVAEIRSSTETNTALQARLGLSSASVSRIRNYKTRTIEEPKDYHHAETT